jgi:CRISPR/Cas system-associated endonuclease Cas1
LSTVAKNLLFLSESGAALQVRRGSLCVRDSDGTETLYPARVHGIRTIILAGHGPSFTGEAIRWAAREGVVFYLMNLSGEAFTFISEAAETDHRRLALAYTPETVAGHSPQDRRH